ncbi:Alpha-L-fucosidase [Pirellulimonas nuda]|uniref:alpha-L-fucosidase n=1 Tax=Pirellulimonas nuda TaxID=2528009 RepID=A0A518D8V7_9BACT|nr:alpha-L-fucosidase [Pirellulimonas nuda]QDU87912.1 Alpha-L-fucosidase [Pirellulimonas nuda]
MHVIPLPGARGAARRCAVLLVLLAVQPFPAARAQDAASEIAQRVDGCVVMDVAQATPEGRGLVWEFPLHSAGTYVVQLVVSPQHAGAAQSAVVRVDQRRLEGPLTRAYLIEDGMVLEDPAAVTLGPEGRHTISVESEAPLLQVRLVPKVYSASRIHVGSKKYYPQWLAMHRSPQKQAALEWFKDARFGMFIHWGVYSEAAGSWQGRRMEEGQGPKVAEWLMFAFQIPRDEYRAFAQRFNPDHSFARNIARLAKQSGMKYVVITAKHHDGFALYDSACSTFDIADATTYQGDLVRELYDACRDQGLAFGVYYSHGNDWMEGADGNLAAVQARDQKLGLATNLNGKNGWDPSPGTHADYLEKKAYPQVAELIALLPDLRLIWFDGEGFITEAQAFRFYRMVYELNPRILVNRRVGYDFGDYYDAGDNRTPDASDLLRKHFETCGTGNRSWGYKAYDNQWKSPHDLLANLLDIVSKGGNYLLNIGPDGKGDVPQACVDNFHAMGEWVHANSDALFGASPWTTAHEGGPERPSGGGRRTTAAPSAAEFWFSAKDDKVYAMSLAPEATSARIGSLAKRAGTVTGVRLLGSDAAPQWDQDDEALRVDLRGLGAGAQGYALEITLQ